MRNIHCCAIALAVSLVSATTAFATQPKIDAETCAQLRLEETKFRQSGILNDMSKGPEWAKANLTPERLREVEHYLTLGEQVEFGCRDAKLSPDAEKASEAASRIEKNSDADPTAPLSAASPKAGGTPPAAADPQNRQSRCRPPIDRRRRRWPRIKSARLIRRRNPLHHRPIISTK